MLYALLLLELHLAPISLVSDLWILLCFYSFA
jgi:hypothetical protein